MPIIEPASQPAPPGQAAAPEQPVAPGRTVGRITAAPAPETRRLYAADWADFCQWCRAERVAPLPACAETVAAFLLARAPGLGRAALARRRAAIAAAHRAAAQPVPVLDAAARRALRRVRAPAAARPGSARPTAARLVQLAARCPGDLAGLRDRAVLLLAAAGRRPSAKMPVAVLLRLDAEDVRFVEAGATLVLHPRSDDRSVQEVVTVPRAATPAGCPVRALEHWMRASDTQFGPVFRKVDRWGNVEHAGLGPDGLRRIVARRTA